MITLATKLHRISFFCFFMLFSLSVAYSNSHESSRTEYSSYATEEPSETLNPEFICVEAFGAFSAKKSSIDNSAVPLVYSRWDARLCHTKIMDGCSGFIFSGGWNGTCLKWQDNRTSPLAQEFFQYLFASCSTYTMDNPLWKWSANGTLFIDPTYPFHHKYSLCRFIFRGNYECSSALQIHFGLINETGLRRQKTRPIFGFVINPIETIVINAVYPVNISAIYLLSPHTSLGTAYRKTSFRKRPDSKRNSEQQQIIDYESQGIEAFLKISVAGVCYLKGTFGYAFSQKIFRQLDYAEEALCSHILPSLYYGASLNLNF
ncbi:hypothetical protein CLAVI_000577 [Candidatus Clavichlamydia salmonicola]|uniref:hypothetical protein n=1 Tax=Candidatus Clavichlamydia salmonicola TaxID=469812 RepID=UPI001890D0C8|nr:hypothetical protein [Candidatus Clavichlamydia salmonicola]MBF5050954.1 hypothetical protein [Candidatus Clavichlamydia salmonicola]